MSNVPGSEGREAFGSYRIDDVLVDALHLELRHPDGRKVAVQPKPLEVLLYLIASHPRLVTREELIDKVWAGNVYVGEKALTNAIWQLRSSFDELGVTGLILTVRKRGYRLGIEPVAEDVAGEDAAVQAGPPGDAGGAVVTLVPKKFPRAIAAGAAAAMVAVLGGAFLLSRDATSAATDTAVVVADPLRLGPGLGRARFSALSPDGSMLAYVWRPYGGTENLYYQRLDDAGAPQQLTFSAHRKGRIAWDHGGRHVVFARNESDGRCELVAIDITTRNEQALGGCRASGATYLAAHPHRGEFYFTGRTENESNLYLMKWDGGAAAVSLVPCTRHCEHPVRDVSVSPDGRHLALTRRMHKFSEDLYVRDLQTGEERRLTTDLHDIIGVDWHPDGRRIIIAADRAGRRDGYLVDIHDGRQVPLDIAKFSQPSRVTPDGTMFFHSAESQVQLAYLDVAPDAHSALFPLTLSEFHYRDPHLNPVSGEFAFVSDRSGHSEIWVADRGLANATQITDIRSVVRYPRWSHDGTRVAFVARFPDEQHDVLSVLELATGRVRRVHQFERVAGRPTWWHDDSAIIVRKSGNLQRLDLATGEMQPLTRDGGVYAQSMANGSVYFTRGTNRGLWKRGADGSLRQVLDPESFGTRYSWVATAAGIYYYDQKSIPATVSFYEFSTGSSVGLLAVPPELVTVQSTFALDAAGERLVIDSVRARSSIASVTHPLLGP